MVYFNSLVYNVNKMFKFQTFYFSVFQPLKNVVKIYRRRVHTAMVS